MIVTRRQLPSIAAALLAAATSLATFATPAAAAAKVQRVVSPGGIEAWFVQDATVPLVAMEYAFAGGSSQDPAGKPGTGSFTATCWTKARQIWIRRPFTSALNAAPSK